MMGETEQRVVLVTVTFNSEGDLPKFLACYESLVNCTVELVVIDNASSDNSVNVVTEFQISHPSVTLIVNDRNMGVALANNQGIRTALGKRASWVILINNDVSFDSDLVEKLIRNPLENVTTPLIPYYDDPATIWFSTGKFSALKGFTGTHINKDRPTVDLNTGSKEYSDYAPTCCMAIRSEVFSVVGLMDDTYFVYFDDTDFCWRLKKAGYRIRFVDDARLLHKVGSSTGGVDSPFTIKFTSRNRILFLRKHKGSSFALAFVPIFFGYYWYKYLVKSWRPDLLRLSLRETYSGFMISKKVGKIE